MVTMKRSVQLQPKSMLNQGHSGIDIVQRVVSNMTASKMDVPKSFEQLSMKRMHHGYIMSDVSGSMGF